MHVNSSILNAVRGGATGGGGGEEGGGVNDFRFFHRPINYFFFHSAKGSIYHTLIRTDLHISSPH